MVTLDLCKSCKDSTENLPIFLICFPLMLTDYITMEHLSQLRNQRWYVTTKQTLDSIWTLPIFS